MKKEKILDILSKTTLFENLTIENIDYLLGFCNYTLRDLDKDSIIYHEDQECSNVGIVLEGRVNISKMNIDGSSMTIKTMGIGDSFGDALLFSSYRSCHSTIITADPSKVLFISSEDILHICELDEVFLRNFLRSLSNNIRLLNKKIRILSYPSVRERLICFLLEEYKTQKSKYITLDLTREELGDLLAVARPSISRELSKMEKDGLITVKGREISIIDLDKIMT